MNNKMAINNTYQQMNLKNKLSKQEEQRQNQGYRGCFEMVGRGERGMGEMGEEVRGLRITKR